MATCKRIGVLAGIAASAALGASLTACSGGTPIASPIERAAYVNLTALAEHEVIAHGGTVSTYLSIGAATGYAAGDGHAPNSTVKCYAGNLGIADAQADLSNHAAVFGSQDGVQWGCVIL